MNVLWLSGLASGRLAAMSLSTQRCDGDADVRARKCLRRLQHPIRVFSDCDGISAILHCMRAVPGRPSFALVGLSENCKSVHEVWDFNYGTWPEVRGCQKWVSMIGRDMAAVALSDLYVVGWPCVNLSTANSTTRNADGNETFESLMLSCLQYISEKKPRAFFIEQVANVGREFVKLLRDFEGALQAIGDAQGRAVYIVRSD